LSASFTCRRRRWGSIRKSIRWAPIKAGATVAVPNDPVNLQRALWILRDLGLLEIRDSKPVDVTELDVIKNPGGIKIVPLEAAQAPRAIDDVDFAAIQGHFAIYSGLKLTNAFALEKMTTPYINVVAVKRGNAETQWAQDIIAGYKLIVRAVVTWMKVERWNGMWRMASSLRVQA
jgi:D-methionine transport system substrate-binding protein